MQQRIKLKHKEHSGRLRPHEFTSYISLAILLLVVGLSLVIYTFTASASPGPQSGSIGLTGVIQGKPPTLAAHIDSPTNGKHFDASPVAIAGTCPEKTLVELFKNDIFAGSVPCSAIGQFEIDIDLLIGKNTLTAKVYDELNQAGPDSNAVVVHYDALPPQAGALTSLNFGGAQMLLNTDAVFRGVFPDKELLVPINIIGGSPPYAVNIQWGDSNNKVVPRNNNAPFKTGHIYKKSGTYQISIQATDAAGRVAFLTVASIVNGQPSIESVGTLSSSTSNHLLVLWPLYTAVIGVVLAFWLGDRRAKHIMKKRGMVIAPKA